MAHSGQIGGLIELQHEVGFPGKLTDEIGVGEVHIGVEEFAIVTVNASFGAECVVMNCGSNGKRLVELDERGQRSVHVGDAVQMRYCCGLEKLLYSESFGRA